MSFFSFFECCITGYLSQYLQTIESVRSKIDSLASCLLFEIGVAIKTRGFIDLMVSLGLLIPAKMAQLAEPEKSQSDVVAHASLITNSPKAYCQKRSFWSVVQKSLSTLKKD